MTQKRPAALLAIFACLSATALPQTQPKLDSIQEAALAAIKQYGAAQLGAGPLDEFRPRGPGFGDKLGQQHARFDRYYSGWKVLGGDMVAHLTGVGTAKQQFLRFSATLTKPIKVDPKPSLSASSASAVAGKYADGSPDLQPPLIVYAADENGAAPSLAYDVAVTLPGQSIVHVIVSAATWAVLRTFNNVWTDDGASPRAVTGRGRGRFVGDVSIPTAEYPSPMTIPPVYYKLQDLERKINIFYPGPGTLRIAATDRDNAWGSGSLGTDASSADYQTPAVDVHYGLVTAYDYFLRTHSFRGIDNAPPESARDIIAFTQVPYNNAGWYREEQLLRFGTGAGVNLQLVSPDLVGHEFTHAITNHTANLIYDGQSGALNESMSDVFGIMIDRGLRGAAAAGWDIGDLVWTPGRAGDALRYMNDPRRDGDSIDHMTQYRPTLDVHYSSGLPNICFYLLAEGGRHPVSGIEVPAIGAEAAARIFFRALTVYLSEASPFTGAALWTGVAAVDLYGSDSREANAVIRAWQAVGVLR